MSLRRILTLALSFALVISLSPAAAHAALRTDLASGTRGTEVTELQTVLGSLGFLTDKPTGYFGATTEKALKAFQANAQLPQTGYVDPLTRSALNSYAAFKTTSIGEVKGATALQLTQNLYYGNSGDQVKVLQNMLVKLGLYSNGVTGYFGRMTESAVKSFQAKNGLEQTGGVGNKTRAALNAKFANTTPAPSAPTSPATGSGPVPTVSVSVSPTSVHLHDNATLTWTSTNATGCVVYGSGWNQSKPASGSIVLYDFTATQTYKVTCTGAGGSTSASITVPVVSDQTPVPTVTLTANPMSISSGGSATLTWSATNATSCTASGGWSGTTATSGTKSVSLTTDTTYTLSCSGAGGTASKSVTLTVQAPPTQTPAPTPGAAPTVSISANPTNVESGGSTTITWSSTNATSCVGIDGLSGSLATSGSASKTGLTANTTFTIECKNSTGGTQKSVTVTVTAPPPAAAPTITFTADPMSIANGGSTKLTWSTTNATSCTASGGWTGSTATSGATTRTNLTADTTFTLACTGSGGTTSKSVTVAVAAAQPAPTPAPTVTFSANPTSIANGGSTTLSWSSTNATSCNISGTGYNTNQPTSGSVTISNLSATQTYTLSCSGTGGSANKQVTITVAAPTQPNTPAPAPTPSTSGNWVMGYYSNYNTSLYPTSAIDWPSLTHIIVGPIIPNSDGTIQYGDTNLLKDVSSKAHANGKKALFMIGGAGYRDGFVNAASAANRAKFVDNLANGLTAYGYDGLDLDWEPLTSGDSADFKAFVIALRQKLPNAVITLPIGSINPNYETPLPVYKEVAPYLDAINFMSYEVSNSYPGWMSWHSSPLAGETSSYPISISSSVTLLANSGVPKNKIGVGTGFMGQCWTGVTGPRMSGGSMVAGDNTMSYTNIMNKYYTSSAYNYDTVAKVPYLSSASGLGSNPSCNFISYEDATSLAAKSEYIKANGLRGTIIWTINEGYLGNKATIDERNPQLRALKAGLLN